MAADYYLKIDTIPGECKVSGHENEIEIESFSWGVRSTGAKAFGGNGVAARAAFQDVNLVKRFDRASTALLQACCLGQHIPKATLTCRKRSDPNAGATYLTITMTDVLVSSWTAAGGFKNDLRLADGTSVPTDPDGFERPSESFSLNFTKVEFDYAVQNDGTNTTGNHFGWDQRNNSIV